MDTMIHGMSDAEFQDMVQQLSDGDGWEMGNFATDFDDDHGHNQGSADGQASFPSDSRELSTASPSADAQDLNAQAPKGDEILGVNINESAKAGPVTGASAITDDELPSFEEVANSGIGIIPEENFNFEGSPNIPPPLISCRNAAQLSQPKAMYPSLAYPHTNILAQGQNQTSQTLANELANQGPRYRPCPQIPINCNTATTPVYYLIPSQSLGVLDPRFQGLTQQNVADGVNWRLNGCAPFPAVNNVLAKPVSLSQPLDGAVQGYLLPSNTDIVPRKARNSSRQKAAAAVGKNAVSSVAPIMSYGPDEVYSSYPLVVPTVVSTDLTRMNRRFAPSPLYTPLKFSPRPWDCFRYNQYGELDPAQLYTPEEIMKYLFNHPLQSGQDRRSSPLRILVQRNPPSARHRYPTIFSNRCRFHECPYPTINQGHLRVGFSESSITGTNHDPYILAAYVHLWCLERFCDLPRIISQLNFSADKRTLPFEPKQRNGMRLALTHEKGKIITFEEHILNNFIQTCRDGTLDPNYPRYDQPNRPHEGTLTHQLSVEKLKREPKSVARQRSKRVRQAGYEGSTLTTHLGNLELEAEYRKRTRLHVNQNRWVDRPRRTRMYHSAAQYEEALDDEEAENDESEEEVGYADDQPTAPSAESIAPVANMVDHGVQSIVGRTKRSRENDMESDPAFKRQMTRPSSIHPVTGLQLDHFAISPTEATINSWTGSPAPIQYGSPEPYLQSVASVFESDVGVYPTADHRRSIIADLPAGGLREQRIQRLKQQLQMLEAHENANA